MSNSQLIGGALLFVPDDSVHDNFEAHIRSIGVQVKLELDRQYPGHPWQVYVHTDGSAVQIINLLLSGQTGYTIHTVNLHTEHGMRDKVREAGGALLELYRVDRGFIPDMRDAYAPHFGKARFQ